MRPIRFRAWALDYPNCTDDKLPKKMFYNVGLTDFRSDKWDYIVRTSRYIDYSSDNSKAEDYDNVKWFDFDAKLMQYTGLKDKSGREIYEGDICRVKPMAGNDNKGDLGQVYYDNGQWSLGKPRLWGYHLPDMVNYNQTDDAIHSTYLGNVIEVIGNIHENPELMP